MEVIRTDLKVDNTRDVLCFVLENVYNKEECDALIKLSEDRGYEYALVNVGNGREVYNPHVRDNDRCIIDDEELAEKLYSKIKAYIPSEFKGKYMPLGEAVGLNERLRFLRYDKGQSFKAHKDGCFFRKYGPRSGERSYITVQIYLNEGFEGGETTFFVKGTSARVPVVPKIGSVLIFQHDLRHEGSLLVSGRKYAIRTDVMYQPKDES